MLRIPRTFEYIYAFLALWFFFGNPISLLFSGSKGGQLIDPSQADSNFLLPGISMLIASVATLILLNRWQRAIAYLKGNPQFALLAFLLLLIMASVQWSAFPNYTLRRSVLVLGTTIFAVFFAVRFDFRQQLKLLTFAFCATIFLCFVFSLALPEYGIMTAPHAGAWRGVHMHKNRLGAQMGFIFVFLWVVRSTDLFKGLSNSVVSLFAGGAVCLVVASTSTTGLVIALALMLIAYFCNTLRLSYRHQVPVTNTSLAVIILVALYVQSNLATILGFFGKGTDLTGRGDLWPTIIQMVLARPLLGYGYEGFWRGTTSPSYTVWKAVGWPAPNAHNGLLDMLLAVGLLGGVLFALSFMLNLLKVFLRVQVTKDVCAICPVLALVFLMISNTTETALFLNDSWILYVWISLLPLQPETASAENLLGSDRKSRELSYANVRQ